MEDIALLRKTCAEDALQTYNINKFSQNKFTKIYTKNAF